MGQGEGSTLGGSGLVLAKEVLPIVLVWLLPALWYHFSPAQVLMHGTMLPLYWGFRTHKKSPPGLELRHSVAGKEV